MTLVPSKPDFQLSSYSKKHYDLSVKYYSATRYYMYSNIELSIICPSVQKVDS